MVQFGSAPSLWRQAGAQLTSPVQQRETFQFFPGKRRGAQHISRIQHGQGPASPAKLYRDAIPQLKRSRETTLASPRLAPEGIHSPLLWGQETNDPIGLPIIEAPNHNPTLHHNPSSIRAMLK
jgi:hypothetical protein